MYWSEAFYFYSIISNHLKLLNHILHPSPHPERSEQAGHKLAPLPVRVRYNDLHKNEDVNGAPELDLKTIPHGHTHVLGNDCLKHQQLLNFSNTVDKVFFKCLTYHLANFCFLFICQLNGVLDLWAVISSYSPSKVFSFFPLLSIRSFSKTAISAFSSRQIFSPFSSSLCVASDVLSISTK